MTESARVSRVRHQCALDDVVGAPSTGDGFASLPPAGRGHRSGRPGTGRGPLHCDDRAFARRDWPSAASIAVPRRRSVTCSTPSICSFAASCAAIDRCARMTVMPGLVLVHGGAHAADCWELTVAELTSKAPELRVLAVDLPGRGGRPADLETMTVAGWLNSAVADIEDAGFDDVVVVGTFDSRAGRPGHSREARGRPGARNGLTHGVRSAAGIVGGGHAPRPFGAVGAIGSPVAEEFRNASRRGALRLLQWDDSRAARVGDFATVSGVAERDLRSG